MRPYSIEIDADASPSGYVAWYNHSSEKKRIMLLKPAVKNERYGVQRMEMLAVYFALADNLVEIKKAIRRGRKSRRVTLCVRSDSKSTVDQLLGLCAIRDLLMQKIFRAIAKLLAKIRCTIRFDHLGRSNNMAGLLIEQKRRKERESQMVLEKTDLYGIPNMATIMPPLIA
ncbi:MAG TPA: hypothetical protein VI338_02265 [Nitrososphaera sp.]|nr:hypothetical protein [Nitrososphaera sp.]